MNIRATIHTGSGMHHASTETNGTGKTVAIPRRQGAPGSSVNGGELLCLALATCYGNDIFREAALRNIVVDQVEVTVEAMFGAAGEPAQSIRYQVRLSAQADEETIADLIRHTDAVAEIQNTIRQGMPVVLDGFEARSTTP